MRRWNCPIEKFKLRSNTQRKRLCTHDGRRGRRAKSPDTGAFYSEQIEWFLVETHLFEFRWQDVVQWPPFFVLVARSGFPRPSPKNTSMCTLQHPHETHKNHLLYRFPVMWSTFIFLTFFFPDSKKTTTKLLKPGPFAQVLSLPSHAVPAYAQDSQCKETLGFLDRAAAWYVEPVF